LEYQGRVRVELAAKVVVRFWLAGQELNLVELKAFQLITDSGE